MAGVYHLDIKESDAELKKLLVVEKTGSGKDGTSLYIRGPICSRHLENWY